jgi:hypothetical protein
MVMVFPCTFIGYPQKHAITTKAATKVVPQISVQVFLYGYASLIQQQQQQ